MTHFPDLKDLIHDINTGIEGVEGSQENSAFAAVAPEPTAKYILVTIGARSLAIAIDNLAEVGAIPPVTLLPNLPIWIKGIMNIRSEIISMIDFAGFLGDEQGQNRSKGKLVVLRNEKMKVGIAVDAIVGTVTKNLSEITEADLSGRSDLETVLFAQSLPVDNAHYSILSVDTLLSHPKLVDFSEES